jgi:hypothetical protein
MEIVNQKPLARRESVRIEFCLSYPGYPSAFPPCPAIAISRFLLPPPSPTPRLPDVDILSIVIA